MFVSKSLDYAFRALTHMRNPMTSVSIRELSEDIDVPHQYLSKIMRALVKGEIIESVKGPGGGYRLTRELNAISTAQVFEAIEGKFQVIGCMDGSSTCSQSDECAHLPVWARLESQIQGILADTMLEEFLPPIIAETQIRKFGA